MGSVEEEIFEITDFTCVTDWERFVGDLEARIRDWQLNDESPSAAVDIIDAFGKKTKKTEDATLKDNPQTVKIGRLIEQLKYGEKTEFKVTYIFPQPQSTPMSSPSKVGSINVSTSKKSNIKPLKNMDNTKLGYLPSSIRDLLEQNYDFIHESMDMGHHIVRYYGLKRFMVVEPSSFASSATMLQDDNIINLLKSAILVASLNTGCDIPIFLQVADQWRWLYNGICQNINTRTYFEMAHLRNPPPKCCHLAGILDMFKEQVAYQSTSPPPVKVSLRITYELRESFDSNWQTQVLNDFEGTPEKSLGVKDFGRLPFGAVQDTIDKFYLSATWLNLNEDMLVENDVYSDLDPLTAPHWNTTADFTDGGVMLLTEVLTNYFKLTGCHKNVDEILGPLPTDSSTAASALGRLTNSRLHLDMSKLQSAVNKTPLHPLISSQSPSSVSDGKAPLDDDALRRLLDYLFPDAGLERGNDKKAVKGKEVGGDGKGKDKKESVSNFPGSVISVAGKKSTGKDDSSQSSVKGEFMDKSEIEACLRRSKKAPVMSLTSRLAMILCHLSESMQGRLAVAHLWREFILELRFRWEQGISLPGFDDSNPGLADCILHQKLQMLNCCILHKLKRQQQQQILIDNKSCGSSSSSKATDEFFDCFEDEEAIDSATSSRPEGRLKSLAPDVFLFENPSEQLYIPLTQDPAPVTEDILEQYGRMLTSMGTSEESAFARAKMQTPSLLSDMEAFKAANPKAIMEDFIRWYSPRDWVEELDRETGRLAGRLSDRMSIPGNLWREVWDNARPIPVSRQKRLFDDTTEAEKILHWLNDMQMSEFVRLTLAPLFSLALLQLNEEAGIVNRLLVDKWKALTSQFIQTTMRNTASDYEDLFAQLTEIEKTISQYRSLIGRLTNNIVQGEEVECDFNAESDIQNFALQLLTEKDVKILGASRSVLGLLFSNMFSMDDRLRFETPSETSKTRFPPFYSKEYILRWSVPRPQAASRECPQRFYVRVKSNEFRAASALTEDVVFFMPEKL